MTKLIVPLETLRTIVLKKKEFDRVLMRLFFFYILTEVQALESNFGKSLTNILKSHQSKETGFTVSEYGSNPLLMDH